ncbi:MAG: hypothetical protein NTX03_01880 [Bacteroidetes bacterium]|nr:hypothetical protein [Bacteroidota bacterium]
MITPTWMEILTFALMKKKDNLRDLKRLAVIFILANILALAVFYADDGKVKYDAAAIHKHSMDLVPLILKIFGGFAFIYYSALILNRLFKLLHKENKKRGNIKADLYDDKKGRIG